MTKESQKTGEFLVGAASGTILTTLNNARILRQQETTAVPEEGFIEYYHWGIVSWAVGHYHNSAYSSGLSTSLVVSEGARLHPFGIGKSPETFKKSVLLTMALLGVLVAMEGFR